MYIQNKFLKISEKCIVKIYFRDANKPGVGEIQQFCVRFKSPEVASEFKEKFEKCQTRLLDTAITSPERKTSEQISAQRQQETSARTDKLKDELLFFKDKFKNGTGLAPGISGKNGVLIYSFSIASLTTLKI